MNKEMNIRFKLGTVSSSNGARTNVLHNMVLWGRSFVQSGSSKRLFNASVDVCMSFSYFENVDTRAKEENGKEFKLRIFLDGKTFVFFKPGLTKMKLLSKRAPTFRT